ncbi:MAG: hypothetical protein QXO74_05340 [Candidatus Methanomethylicia archaeon]
MGLKKEYIPILLSLSLSFMGLFMSIFIQDHLLLLYSSEIAFLTLIFSFTILVIHFLPPKKIDAENIFLCGLAKPPYLEYKNIYRLNLPRMVSRISLYLVYLTLIFSFLTLLIVRLKMGVV